MADPTLFQNAANVGITITNRGESSSGTESVYYCLGGPNYNRTGQWVKVTTANTDGQKLTAIQAALS